MTEAAIKVFFSYLHRDEEFKDELEKHLSILQHQGVISGWHDRMIMPGSEWDREIDEQLSTADIILLMVSSDFLASKYCWGVEVKKALQRHEAGDACVIPVVLRRVVWQGAPFAKLQALPKNAELIANWNNRDDAFYDVATGISIAAQKLREAQRRRQEGERQAAEKVRLEAEARQRQEGERQAELQRQAAERARREAEVREQKREQAQVTKLERQAAENARREARERNAGKLKYLIMAGIGGAIILGVAISPKSQPTSQPSQSPAASPTPTPTQMTAEDFFDRALKKQNSGDKQGAIADYTKAIKFKTDYATAYYNRGNTRSSLGDKQAAIADFQKAADLYQQQGKTQDYQDAMDRIKKLQL